MAIVQMVLFNSYSRHFNDGLYKFLMAAQRETLFLLADDFFKYKSSYSNIQNFTTIEIIFKEFKISSLDKCNCTISYNNMKRF